MNTSKKRFEMARFRFETDTGGYIDRYMITDNALPMFKVNQWKNRSIFHKEYGMLFTREGLF